MISNNYTLTKTKILSGLQCHKKLWYDFHQQISKDNHSIHIGNRFGEEVKKKYKDGYGKFKDFTGPFDSSKVKDTEEAINSDNINVIFEGAFIYLDTLIRADVLIRKKNGWELLEAKSSTKLKSEYIEDIAIQSFIVKKCGVNLTSIKLIHINKDFIYEGGDNYEDLINDTNDITSKVILKEKEVSSYIKDLIPLADKKESPNISMGDHCNNPHVCDYQSRCKAIEPKTNITTYEILPWFPKKLKKYCLEKKIKDLQKVPTDLLVSQREGYVQNYHKIIQAAHKCNKPWFSKELKNVIKEFNFPYYFMDFEYVNQGVPIIKGTQPYYRLPFQWSVHKWESIDKKIKPSDEKPFLEFDDQDIERKFVESLLKAVGENGTIFAHNAVPVEISILKKLKEKDNCKHLVDKIDKLIERTVDTQILVGENFYHPKMNGKYKLKEIIKAIPSDVSYEEKDNISGGTEAQLAWFILTDSKTLKNEKELQKKLLLEYCAKDTLALYYLIKFLMEKSNEQS